jgi:hypothetical protein
MPMFEEPSFRDLIDRIRPRDEQAAAELVWLYEPTIRMAIRLRLSDPALRRLLDSMDICQSVLANFFVRAAAGQFEGEAGRVTFVLALQDRSRCPAALRDSSPLTTGNAPVTVGGMLSRPFELS